MELPSYYSIFWWTIALILLAVVLYTLWTWIFPIITPIPPIPLIRGGLKIQLQNTNNLLFLGTCQEGAGSPYIEVIGTASQSDPSSVWEIVVPASPYSGTFLLALKNVISGLYLFADYGDGQCPVNTLFVSEYAEDGGSFSYNDATAQAALNDPGNSVWWRLNIVQPSPLQVQFLDMSLQSTLIAGSNINDSFCQGRACQDGNLNSPNGTWNMHILPPS